MIEKMTLAHVSAVAELEKLCFSDPWSERSIASELNNPLSLWLIAVVDGKVAGYIGSQSVPPEADVMNVAVYPQYRGRGMGEQLMRRLREDLREQGMESLTLEVRAGNTPAIRLYEKLGFLQVGLRPRYYVNPTEDALILRKEL